ncbi:MAG: efflux RND transporter permease subunit, partial [Planctomycetota bacterium]
RNSIAANLAMIVLLVGGVMFASRVTQEVFPDFDLDVVTVHVDYPGASPAEVEQGILRSVEDRVEGLDDVKKVTSYAVEGGGTVSVEVTSGGDRDKLLQDVKNEVDRITTFPVEAEQPEVGLASRRRQVLSVIVHGDVPEGSLRAYAERVRDALVARDGITLVELTNVRGHEVAIEIPESELRALGISLPQVARIVSDNALELAAGEVKVSSGAVLLRTQERRDAGLEFADLPLVTSPDGTVVRIGDVGRVVDGFEETDLESRFDGIPAIEVVVYRVGDETPLQVAATSREVLADLESDAPEAIGLEVWDDQSATYGARIDLLSRNALLGLGLVLLLLGLFLEPRIAFWVTIGIMISVVGSFLVFPATGATINLVSLFAFIVTLGIVVDDAIIVGENIYEWRSRGVPPLEAAIRGTREIAAPVVFAVLTNIVAFMPLFFVPGASGKIFLQIPAVVVSVFAISLVESLFILPAHLAHDVKPGRLMRLLSAPNRAVTRGFDRFSETVFAPLVTASLRGRYVVPALGIALLMVSVGVVRGGFVRWSFLPRVDSDVISV